MSVGVEEYYILVHSLSAKKAFRNFLFMIYITKTTGSLEISLFFLKQK